HSGGGDERRRLAARAAPRRPRPDRHRLRGGRAGDPRGGEVDVTDLLVRAGSIETFDDAAGVVRSLAVDGGRVTAVGREPHELDDLRTPGTVVVDDPDLYVLPAFH